jgi:predicted ArsR family transcriptional regulator
MEGFEDQVAGVAALDEPVRRDLYRYVVEQAEPVSRDRAAVAVGIARSLAAFHLDKLAAAGLLDVEYRRPPGRSGPGAGRPAKLYRRAARQVDVTLPPRRYELAGRILADAVAGAEGERRSVARSLARAARQVGVELAEQVRVRAGRRPSRRRLAAAAAAALERHGYEPLADGAATVLRNCPFHALADVHTELICGMNADLLSGFTEALPELGLVAQLDPQPGRCCVALTPASTAG